MAESGDDDSISYVSGSTFGATDDVADREESRPGRTGKGDIIAGPSWPAPSAGSALFGTAVTSGVRGREDE